MGGRTEYHKQYYQTEKGKRSRYRNQWKYKGMIADNWDEVYDWYMETTHCDICSCLLTIGTHNTKSTKCLDHDHTITDDYNIRGVICCSCNSSHQTRV